MKRTAAILMLLALLASLLAGCGNEASGPEEPGGSGGETSAPSTPSATPSTN